MAFFGGLSHYTLAVKDTTPPNDRRRSSLTARVTTAAAAGKNALNAQRRTGTTESLDETGSGIEWPDPDRDMVT